MLVLFVLAGHSWRRGRDEHSPPPGQPLCSARLIAFPVVAADRDRVDSFNTNTLLARWNGVTTHWYSEAPHDQNVRTGLKTTLIIAVASSAMSLVVAVTGALWWRRPADERGRFTTGSIYARIMLPEVVFAMALFLLFLKIHFPLGLTAIVIGHRC